MHENCNHCNTDYEYDASSCTLNLFIENPECNHIETTCPHCGQVERVYAHADTFLHVMHELEAGVSLHARADEKLQAAATACWASVAASEEPPALDELPAAPKQLLRELYDDLRNWRGEPI